MEEKDFDFVEEANRCLQCVNPSCIKGCPLKNNIPCFLKKVQERKFEEAYEAILETSILPEICSRVCSQYNQCEGNCALAKAGKAIHIGEVEKNVADLVNSEKIYVNSMKKIKENANGNQYRIAVVGTGPSSIECAYILRKKGYQVTMFEKENFFGGVLAYGIPKERLPKNNVEMIEKKLLQLGITVEYEKELGKNISINEIKEKGFDAIYLGLGLAKPKRLNIPGEKLENIYTANDFLYQINSQDALFDLLKIKDKTVAIIGGGNVALDCALVALENKAKSIKVIYRRTQNELLMSEDERKFIESGGAEFCYLTEPIVFIGDKKVQEMECLKVELTEKDNTGRRRPVNIEDTNFKMQVDLVITCIGSKLDIDMFNDVNIDVDNENLVIVNEEGQTNIPYVFAGGDMCGIYKKRVASAANSGKISAEGIDKYIREKILIS